MAASGYTPISLYYSTTASAVPTSGNLANGELGLNIADMKLYAKNSAGTVTLLASNAGASGSVTSVSGTGTVNGLTLTGTVTTSGSLTLGGTLSLVSPPPIGSTTPNTGAFTSLSATGNLTSLTAQFGTNPAGVSIGVIGIPNQKRIYGRNTTNSSDINILYVDGNNNVVLGPNDNATFTQTSMGVGTASPATTVHAVATGGAIRIQDNIGTSKYIQMRSDSTNSHLEHIGGPGDALRINNQAAGTIELYTSNTERLRISSGGDVVIGGTTTSGKFTVYDANASIRASSSAGPSIRMYAGLVAIVETTTNDDILFRVNGTERFRFATAGQLGIGGANYGTSGQVLTSGGPSAAPTWATAGGGSQAFVAFGSTGGL